MRHALTTVVLFSVLALSASALPGHAEAQSATPITQCTLKSEVIVHAKVFIAKAIKDSKEAGLTPREGAEERLLAHFLEVIGQSYLLVDRREDCPKGMTMQPGDSKKPL